MSDVVVDWIARVLQLDVRAAHARGGAAKDTAAFTARLIAIQEDMQGLSVLGEFGPDLKRAAEAVKGGDPQAAGLVDALETRLAEIANERRRRQVQAEIGKAAIGQAGVVGFAKVRLKWDSARNSFHQAGANLEAAGRALVTTSAFANDARSTSPELQQKLGAIANKLPSIEGLAGEIEATLDAIGTAENGVQLDGNTRDGRIAAAVKAIDGYLAELAKEPMLKALQLSEAGGLPIVDMIGPALGALRAELTG
jgi:hypothetical protein